MPLLILALLFAASEDLGRRVTISPLRGDTWLIRSVSVLGEFGEVESNAVLAAGPRESVLIDTPATEEQTAVVLEWAATRLKRPVRHLVVTHWHSDRMGGIDAAASRGIATYALGKTIELARRNGLTPPQHELRTEHRLTLAGVELEVFHPGHGHTVDNAVVWFPRESVLDGGCFVKSVRSTGLGNTREIDAVSWGKGIALVRRRYGKATAVVPGHGDPGGPELLAHTAALLE